MGAPLDIQEHQSHAANGWKDARVMHNNREQDKLDELKWGSGKYSMSQMDQACKSRSWLTVMPIFMDDTDISAKEFCDKVFWRLGLEPRPLPTNYNGCGAPFTADHACLCKIGRLINPRHKILVDEWGDLWTKFLTMSEVSDKPRIHTGRLLNGEGSRRASEESTKMAKLQCNARGDDPAEGGPSG